MRGEGSAGNAIPAVTYPCKLARTRRGGVQCGPSSLQSTLADPSSSGAFPFCPCQGYHEGECLGTARDKGQRAGGKRVQKGRGMGMLQQGAVTAH